MSGLARQIADEIVRLHRANNWRAEKETLFSPRRIDVLAIAPGGSEVVAFEVKISRADFRNEIRNPSKREHVIKNCTQFYFVCPVGVIPVREMPPRCGLIHYEYGQFETIILCSRKSLLCRIEQERRIWELYEREGEYESMDDPNSEIPPWMLPRPEPRPLRFQFDIHSVAFRMAHVLVPHQVNFEVVPF